MLLRIADFFFVLRPLILVPAWSFYILGAHSARRPVLATVLNMPGFLCLSAILACAYVLNQIFDEESDRLNDKGHYLTDGIFGVRTMLAIAFVCFVAAALFFRQVQDAQRYPLLAALLLSFVYSLPPLRLCARPGLDLAANAVGYGGLAFVIGRTGSGGDMLRAFVDAAPWMLLVGATFMHTTILDVDGDTASRKRTTTVALGVMPSARLAVGLAAVAAAAAVVSYTRAIVPDLAPVVVTMASLAAFMVALAALERARGRDLGERTLARTRASGTAVQVVTGIVAVAAVLRDPIFILLLIPLVLAARLYYRARFGVPYPGRA